VVGRFVDRHIERRALEDAWASGRPELVVVHGRRRVGKSELLARFAARKPFAYYVAAQQLERDQLADLGVALAPLSTGFRRGRPPRLALRDWDELLAVVADAATSRRIGLVLDEFPYLVDSNPALPSLVQRWWDAVGSKANVMLVLSGSKQAMMARLVSEEGALYGRPTRRLHLRAFDYFHAAQFARAWSPEDRIRLYAVAGSPTTSRSLTTAGPSGTSSSASPTRRTAACSVRRRTSCGPSSANRARTRPSSGPSRGAPTPRRLSPPRPAFPGQTGRRRTWSG
jgi:AAA+ ATPase superfamily predicted ATPase